MTRLSGGRPSPPGDGQICALFAVDIAEFTRPDRDDDIRRYLHKGLYEMLATGFGQSGPPAGAAPGWGRSRAEARR